MRVVSLASGSSGNATLIEAGKTMVLVDAGLQPRVLLARLHQVGCKPEDLTGIILTHEHSDHTSSAVALAQQYHLPVSADARTLAALLTTIPPEDQDIPITTEAHASGSTWQIGALSITSFPVPHDAVAPCGYLISSGAWRICLVTDCGAMTETILAHLRQANLIILEANHDRDRLIHGPYPYHLKQRILSPRGHLANDETAEALHLCLDETPRWIWLVHLSKTNNTPELALSTVTKRLGTRRLRHIPIEVAAPTLGPTWDSTQIFGRTGR